jgi:hypothetical protein
MISPIGYHVFFNAKPRAALCISGAAQHSDDAIRSPAVGQRSRGPARPGLHARPRPKPGAHLSVADTPAAPAPRTPSSRSPLSIPRPPTWRTPATHEQRTMNNTKF